MNVPSVPRTSLRTREQLALLLVLLLLLLLLLVLQHRLVQQRAHRGTRRKGLMGPDPVIRLILWLQEEVARPWRVRTGNGSGRLGRREHLGKGPGRDPLAGHVSAPISRCLLVR